MIVFQTYIYIYIELNQITEISPQITAMTWNKKKKKKKGIMRPKIAQHEPIAYEIITAHYSYEFEYIYIYIYIYNLELGNVPSSQTKLNIYKVAFLHSCLGNHKRSINHVHSTWPSPCFFELLLSHTWKKMKNKKKH